MIDSAQLRRIATAAGHEDLIFTKAFLDVARAVWTAAQQECAEHIKSENDTWTGDYKPVVKVALQHCLQRIDPDATL